MRGYERDEYRKNPSSRDKVNASLKVKDCYGSFFGPPQRVIAPERKSLLEKATICKTSHKEKKSSVSAPVSSKSQASRKITRDDYSFLFSEDAEVPASTKGPPPRNVSAPRPGSLMQILLQLKRSPPRHPPRATLRDERRPKAKPKRQLRDDDSDCDNAINLIRKMFRYNPNKFRDDDDTADMEANFDDIMREEKRSARIAKQEDDEQLRLVEEEERRERMRQAKKRKTSH